MHLKLQLACTHMHIKLQLACTHMHIKLQLACTHMHLKLQLACTHMHLKLEHAHANLMLNAYKHFLYFLHRQRLQVISHSSGQLQSPLGREQTPVATSSHIQACLFPTDISTFLQKQLINSQEPCIARWITVTYIAHIYTHKASYD